MKSEKINPRQNVPGPRVYQQQKVATYAVFDDVVAACDKANRQHESRHYVMNDSGKEYYADTWID
jgi:hypothetical protein